MFGTRHPPTANDRIALGRGRVILGWITLLFIFIGLTPTPIDESKPAPQTRPPIRRSVDRDDRVVEDVAEREAGENAADKNACRQWSVLAKYDAVNPQALKGNPTVNPQALKGTVNPALGKPGPQAGGLKNGPSFGKVALGPAAGLRPGTFIKVGNKSWPIHKGPYKLWWAGGWKTFVPFGVIGAALIGGAYYYPDAYVSVARPYCSGVTPDGCQLNWQQVAFEGGGSEWQCVQYCQRPGQPPPPRAVALVAAPPAPANGRCEVEIFAQPKLTGVNAPSSVDQPRLAEAGWKNEIASVQVKAGTWDFFSEDEFAGESMRLPPGPYPELGPQWTKRIGSFMCVQGG